MDKKIKPGYMADTISSSAKYRKRAQVIKKENIRGQKWNASTKPNNPDGPILPLPLMNNYRKKMDAPRKKQATLLKKIQSNKKEALQLINSYESREAAVEQFEWIDELGFFCKDKEVYSSLPPMGGADEYKQQYTIIYEDHDIGEGGSGVVYLGWRLSEKKEVAIKKVKKSNVNYWGSVNGKNYPIEYCHLQMVAKAGCSNIANIIDAFEIEDEFIFILETMDVCSSLDCYLQDEGPIEEQQCKLIFRQLVEGVGQCHNSGIFHRDIKLGNVLIEDDTNEVKLIDFDISALAHYSPFMDNPGTCNYMSPEMYDGSVKYEGSAAAVYSLGVVLYDLVFHAEGWKLIDNRLPMPKISNECLDLICKMTATRPEDRLSFKNILRHPWMKSTTANGNN